MGYVIDFGHNYISQTIKNIYGIKFTGSNPGTRLYDSIGLQFTPSNTTTAGRDDFITIEDSPFHIRECITNYNSSTGKQEILAYEGDSNWSTLVTNKTGNRMIEFPKFYYKRPSAFEWQVSSIKHDGFKCSPMHYRNGRELDYFYVGKYMPNSSFQIQTGYNINKPYDATQDGAILNPNDTFTEGWYRNNFRSRGMYMFDYATLCSINMLMFVKYGHLNMQNFIGYGKARATNDWTNILPTGRADNVKGKDGYSGSSVSDDAAIVAMGIENYWGNIWTKTDGIVMNGDTVYVNTNIESITSSPTLSNKGEYVQVSTKCAAPPNYPNPNYQIFSWNSNSIAFDNTYDWMMFPTSTLWVATGVDRNYEGTKNYLINDGYWNESVNLLDQLCEIGTTGCAFNGNACGPLCQSSYRCNQINTNTSAMAVAII